MQEQTDPQGGVAPLGHLLPLRPLRLRGQKRVAATVTEPHPVDRFRTAAAEVHQTEKVLQAVRADHEAALREYRQAARDLARLAESLGVRPRGGPGTYCL